MPNPHMQRAARVFAETILEEYCENHGGPEEEAPGMGFWWNEQIDRIVEHLLDHAEDEFLPRNGKDVLPYSSPIHYYDQHEMIAALEEQEALDREQIRKDERGWNG